jgi:hypothetical protein
VATQTSVFRVVFLALSTCYIANVSTAGYSSQIVISSLSQQMPQNCSPGAALLVRDNVYSIYDLAALASNRLLKDRQRYYGRVQDSKLGQRKSALHFQGARDFNSTCCCARARGSCTRWRCRWRDSWTAHSQAAPALYSQCKTSA